MSSYRSTRLEKIEVRGPSKADLPLIFDDWSLAFRLGVTGKALWFAIQKKAQLYSLFTLKKKSGGRRQIHNPKPLMRVISKQIRQHFLLPLCAELGEHVGAYQLGRSTLDSARLHLRECETCDAGLGVGHACPRRGVKIHLDLKDFFLSTRRSWIRQYFHEQVGYNRYASGLLADLLTVEYEVRGMKKHGVPQGAISSGDICNLVADVRLDQPILAALPDWTYTRYADDLYLSHAENLPRTEVDEVIATVNRLIERAGYRMNRKKLHVQRPGKQQRILGIVLNQKINIPRSDYRRVRAILTNCLHLGFESQLEKAKKENKDQMILWLRGKINYFATISPEKAEKLDVLFSRALSADTERDRKTA